MCKVSLPVTHPTSATTLPLSLAIIIILSVWVIRKQIYRSSNIISSYGNGRKAKPFSFSGVSQGVESTNSTNSTNSSCITAITSNRKNSKVKRKGQEGKTTEARRKQCPLQNDGGVKSLSGSFSVRTNMFQ